MDEKWYLQETTNLKQVLKIRNDIDLDQTIKQFPNLVIIRQDFKSIDLSKISIEQMFIFFTMFENNHLEAYEEENSLALLAVNIDQAIIEFYLYCNDCTQCIEDAMAYLSSNEYCKCECEVIQEDRGESLYQWL